MCKIESKSNRIFCDKCVFCFILISVSTKHGFENRRNDFDAYSGTVLLCFDNFYFLTLADKIVVSLPFIRQSSEI